MARGKDTLLVPGDNNEEKVVTANELQLGSTDPKPPGSGVQVKYDGIHVRCGWMAGGIG